MGNPLDSQPGRSVGGGVATRFIYQVATTTKEHIMSKVTKNDVNTTSALVRAAIHDLRDAVAAEASKETVKDLMDVVDSLIADLKDVKKDHVRTLRVVQSVESKAKSKARVQEALALLAEKEKAEESA